MFSGLLLSLLLTAPQAPSTLREDLAQAENFVLAGDGVAAQAKMMELFEAHEANPLVFRHVSAIEEVLLDSLYLQEQARHVGPDLAEGIPDIPFHASVKSYKEKTGKFELRWEGSSQLRDFEIKKERLRFPINLSTKFRLGLVLKAYPQKSQIRILIDNQVGQVFEIDCGLGAEGLNRTNAKVYQISDGRFELLDREDKKLPAPGKEVMLQVKGVGRGLQIYMDKKKLLNFKIGKGQVGFITFEGLDENVVTAMEYDGPLDLVALAEVTEQIRIQNREEFRESVDLKDHTPEWMHPYLQKSGYDLEALIPPGGTPNDQLELAWGQALGMVHWTRYAGLPILGLSRMQDEPPEGLPPVVKEYASLLMASEGGYWSYAKGHANIILRTNPEHASTQHLLIHALAWSGDAGGCWATAMKYYVASQSESLLLIAVMELMRAGRAKEIKTILADEKDLPAAALSRLQDLLSQRVKPSGEAMHTVSSEILEITSDLPVADVEALSHWASGEIERAMEFMPPGSFDGSPLRTFLFSERWDYEEFSSEVIHASHPSQAGFYSQEFDAVVCWLHPNEKDLKDSLRKELMLHLVKRVHPEFPAWIASGLAQMVADGAIVPRQKLKSLSKVSALNVRDAKSEELIRFPVMLHMSDATYYGLSSDRNMEVQAWLMMLALRLSEEDSPLFMLDDLLLSLSEGKTWASAVDAFFEAQGSAEVGEREYERMVKQVGNLSTR